MASPIDCELPLDTIHVVGHNARKRFDAESLGELADDIAANGLINPVSVRQRADGEGYDLIAGERRLRAHELLRRPHIRASVWPAGTPLLDIASAENLLREQLDPMEEADQVRQFVAGGESLAGTARRMRRSQGWCRERLALLELPEDVRAALVAGAVRLGVAPILGQIDHAAYRGELLAEAARTGATTATANVWLAHYQADRERLVANQVTIADMVKGREAWRYYVPCDGCAKEHPYETTRALRFCPACLDAIGAALPS